MTISIGVMGVAQARYVMAGIGLLPDRLGCWTFGSCHSRGRSGEMSPTYGMLCAGMDGYGACSTGGVK